MSGWWVVWIEKGELFIAYYYDLMHPMILFLNDSSEFYPQTYISTHLLSFDRIQNNVLQSFHVFFVCSV